MVCAIEPAIGRRLNLRITSKSAAEAEAHFGWLTKFLSFDNPTSSALTRLSSVIRCCMPIRSCRRAAAHHPARETDPLHYDHVRHGERGQADE